MTSLDDRERARSLASPLYGDRWVQDHATLPVSSPVVSPGGGPAASTPDAGTPAPREDSPPPRETVSLDGEWLLAGAPAGREFAIERWFAGHAPPAPVGWHRPDTDRSSVGA